MEDECRGRERTAFKDDSTGSIFDDDTSHDCINGFKGCSDGMIDIDALLGSRSGQDGAWRIVSGTRIHCSVGRGIDGVQMARSDFDHDQC